MRFSMRYLTRSLPVAAAMATATAALGQAPPLVLEDVGPLQAPFMTAARVTKATLQRLEPQALEDGTLRVAVEVDGALETIRLAPHTMRAEGCVMLVQGADGALRETPLPPPLTYRGALEDRPDVEVAASVIDGALHALIRRDGATWGIQPCAALVPGLFDGWSLVYDTRDLAPSIGRCDQDDPGLGVVVGEDAPEDAAALGSAGGLLIAYDTDVEFFQALGSTDAVIAQIELVMNQVGLIYQSQLGICYKTSGYIVRTAEPDPYSATDSVDLLCQFRTWWNITNPMARGVAHLWTGKNIDGDTIGRACIGGVCNTTQTQCGSSGNAGYGFSQSLFSSNLAERTQLTAHELGHNWNACHCNQSQCTGGGADSDCGIMWSSVDGSLTFGSRSTTTIGVYKLFAPCLTTCYDPVYVDAGDTIPPWTGSSSFPYFLASDGAFAVPVGGEVRFAAGTYSENLTIYKPMTLRRTTSGTTVTIGD